MNTQEFCYWLQGFSELALAEPTHEQWVVIQNNLALALQDAKARSAPHPMYVGPVDFGPDPSQYGQVQVTC